MIRAHRFAVFALISTLAACLSTTEFRIADPQIRGPRAVVLGSTVRLVGVATTNANDSVAVACSGWQSTDVRVLSVTSSGRATGVALGGATVSATCNGASVTADIAVIDIPVASISITPPVEDLRVGDMFVVPITLRDSTGSTVRGRVATWTSSNPSVAWVGTDGSVHAVAAGTTDITVAYDTLSAALTLRVIDGTCAAVPFTLGITLSGTLASSDCRYAGGSYADHYTFTLAEPAAVRIDLSSSAFDAYAVVLGPDGFEFPDDDSGPGTSALLTLDLGAGTYTVIATSFASRSPGAYTLAMRVDPVCDATRTLTLGVVVADTLDVSDCLQAPDDHVQRWRLVVPTTSRVQIDFRTAAFDALLYVYTGAWVFYDADDDSAGGTDARIDQVLTAGTYILEARGFPGVNALGAYTLSAVVVPPSPNPD
jgi:hypothetical protein